MGQQQAEDWEERAGMRKQRCGAALTGQWWCRRRPKRGWGNINFKPHALTRSGPLVNY